MKIRDLKRLVCATMASMIKNMTPEQICALLHVENDFTPEEEEKTCEEMRCLGERVLKRETSVEVFSEGSAR